MDPPKLTEYERRRLENIRRNDEMMKALNIRSKLTQLSESSKRQRVGITKSYKVSPEKKSKPENPVVIRRSLRTRGITPDSKGLDVDFVDPTEKTLRERVSVSPQKASLDFTGPINMRDAYIGDGSDQALIATLLSFQKESEQVVPKNEKFDRDEVVKVEKSDGLLQDNVKIEIKVDSENLNGGNNTESVEMSRDGDMKDYTSTAVVCRLGNVVRKCEFSDVKSEIEKRETESCVNLLSMSLKEENIARVVPGRIMLAKFVPSNNVTMIAVGNKSGNIGFWNVDAVKEEEEEENSIYLYRPHSGPLSGILFQQSCLSKMYTSCYDGFLRLMDVEKEVFDLLYTSDQAIFALSQRPSDDKNLYFGEGYGSLSVYDDKMGKFAHEWSLHAGRINSIDFSSQNTNFMATSSTDGTACIWDLRRINAKKPESLRVVNHEKAVHSAYFSPSAKFLATTSFDDRIGITTGANFEDTSMILHNNQTGRWISSFKAIWGWDDSYVFVGNMKRGVDVISPFQERSVLTLESPLMSAISCRFDAHPFKIGMLAGGTGGGQIYIWTSSCIYA